MYVDSEIFVIIVVFMMLIIITMMRMLVKKMMMTSIVLLVTLFLAVYRRDITDILVTIPISGPKGLFKKVQISIQGFATADFLFDFLWFKTTNPLLYNA